MRKVSSLAPIMGVVFSAYLVIGLAMPVLALHVHDGLGLGTFAVGIVAGSQFVAALLTRVWAGQAVDRRGGRSAVLIGLILAAAAGVLYILSVRFSAPAVSLRVLLIGRALLGAAESFIITGALSWGLAMLGAKNAGKVMSWVGTAIYAAFAVGAPVGTGLFEGYGFVAIGFATLMIPLGTLALVKAMRPAIAPAAAEVHPPLARIVRSIWLPGLGLALGGVGFGAITTFIVLLFAQNGWASSWMAFTALSVAFMLGRIGFGHLPDRIGGARVACACVLIEVAGQAIIWQASSRIMTLLGVGLTGLGYSLMYPSLGVEAIRRAPAQSRGVALGTYSAFLDLSLGVSGPALGWVASRGGLSAVFLVSTLTVLCAAIVAARLLRESGRIESANAVIRADRAVA